jgi:drug/metabolite transporter (DMT)-like permease
VTVAGTAPWLWIPVCLFAAAAQTVRNSAQRSLSGQAGPFGATLARFLYGVPFALVYVVALQLLSGAPTKLPAFTLDYIAVLAAGAAMQAVATALLLVAMNHGNFVVAVTYSKTEVLQVALLGTLLLHELPTALSLGSMVLAFAGVAVLMRAKMLVQPGAPRVPFFGPAALFGLGSGACFAIAAVCYRYAGTALTGPGGNPWLASGWSVLLAQLMQSGGLMAWLLWRDRAALRAVFSGWRFSLTAGMAGALASCAWFLAYVLRPAADVRALGMVEVVFSYLVSRRLLRERVHPLENVGLLLVLVGGIGACLGAR